MYKARNKENNCDITILDPVWASQIERLRELDKSDALLCQACKQPVRVRAGEIKRWHFAHKQLNNCPGSKESHQLLNTRAVLYEWLYSKFKEKIEKQTAKVEIEKIIEGLSLPRPVDLWVEYKGRNFAYWIIDSNIKPEIRNIIINSFRENNIIPNYVFVSDIMHCDEKDADCLHLSTTEREFMKETDYDKIYMPNRYSYGNKGSLHYLDTEKKELITYRRLQKIHEPQFFKGKRIAANLGDVLIAPKNGEFVHPKEDNELQKIKDEEERLRKIIEEEERIREESKNKFSKDLFRKFELKSLFSSASKKIKDSPHTKIYPKKEYPSVKENSEIQEHEVSSSSVFKAFKQNELLGKCVYCGEETTEWVTLETATKECECKKCFFKRHK